MKKLFLILFILSAGVYAQKPNMGNNGKKGPNHEKIKALKTAHITQELDLTSAEAEKFWPIYNAFDSKKMILRKENRSTYKSKIKNGGIDSLTDKEANEIIDRKLKMKATELEYQKQLISDLRNVIPPTKIIKLQRAEESFKRLLLEQLKHRKGKKKNK